MKKHRFPSLLALLLLITPSILCAQMSGIYSVPGSFNSIASAISNLNQFGVVGPVTINIATGYTETAVPGGYSVFTVVGASATNSILIQRFGVGNSPAVYSYTNGSSNSTSPSQDGILSLIGADYLTIDGLTFTDLNTSNPATMDYGVGLFRASGTNGCQYNTIKNCTISLNTINDITPFGVSGSGSKGIFSASSLINSLTTPLGVYAASGGNSYNKFYGNTIINCNSGISLSGPSLLIPGTSGDRGNDIGGNSIATGNYILNFGNTGSVSIVSGVFTEMQSNINISYNFLNSNNGAGSFHTGNVKGIDANWSGKGLESINHNTITVSVADANTAAEAINNSGSGTFYGDTIEIRYNVIENCNSNMFTSGYFSAINNDVNCKKLYISNNVLSNNRFYFNYNNSQNYYHHIVRSYASISDLLSISDNTITAWDKSPVTKNAAGLYAISVGAFSSVGSVVDINNNQFSNFVYDNTNQALLSFIYVAVTANTLHVNNNSWNNLNLNHGFTQQLIDIKPARYSVVANNRIVGTYLRNHNGDLTCYNSNSYTGAYRYHEYVYDNDFSNISCATGTVNNGGSFTGINCGGSSNALGGFKHIYNNNISSITYSASANFIGIAVVDLDESDNVEPSAIHHNTVSGVSVQGGLKGMSIFGAPKGLKGRVFGNRIQGLTSSSGTAVTGLSISAFFKGADVFKNRISDVGASGLLTQVSGVSVISCSNLSLYNNLIGNISAPSSTINNALTGVIVFANSGNLNLDHNTVYLNGSTGFNASSSAITATTGVNLTMRNNILVNLNSPSGTGMAVAFKLSSANLATYDAASNNNLFYAGAPSAGHVIFHNGTSYTTLSNFKSLAGYRDINSVTENPTFVSAIGSAANFLRLSATIATQAESGGLSINNINDDYASASRSLPPDIGAWEDLYLSAGDSAAPVLMASGFTSNACNNAQRTFTANITDVGGVAAGLNAPRVYYRVNNGSYSSSSASLTAGTPTFGTWTFNLGYSAVAGDIISYFVVAQDNSTPTHVMTSAPAGIIASNVNTISQFPTGIQSFTVKTALSGVYTVGASQTFTSLTAAAKAYNNSCLLGPVTFSLTDALYSSLETFPIEFKFHPDANSTNLLTIIPATGTTAVIQPTLGAPGSIALLKFCDARFIEMDGLNSGGSSLSILTANGASTLTAGVSIWLASGTQSSDIGCQNLKFRNLELRGIGDGNNNIGILAATNDTSPFNILFGQDHDSITISGNKFLNFRHAIHAIGKRDTSLGGYDNWSIVNNVFGPPTPGANAVATGVKIGMASDFRIESNTFQNHVITYTGTPVLLESNVKNFSVKGNTISGVSYTGSAQNYIGAIELGLNVRKGTIEQNSINAVRGTNAVRGIRVNTELRNSQLSILNNFVSSCIGNNQYFGSACIEVLSSTGGVKIIHNTLTQSGTVAATNSSMEFSALHIGNSYTTQAGGLDVTDNIFYNTFDNSSSSNEWIYAISCDVPSAIFNTLNYNNYFVQTSGGSASLGKLAGNNANNLSNLISYFGQNYNSTANEPFFVGPSDLHISPLNPMNYFMDNLGGPSTVTTDIDGQTRNSFTPDVGADEFTYTTSCTSASAGTVAPLSISVCQNEPFSLQSFGMSTGINISYQWKTSSSFSGTYTNVPGGQGANGPVYQSSPGTVGITYYVFTATCIAGSNTLTGNSNVVTVSVTPGPNVTILPTTTVLCSGTSATLIATGATNYYWTPGPGTSSFAITPTLSTIYQVTGYNPGCNAVSTATKTIYYSISPTLTVSPASSIVCVGSSITLTASGAQTYTWNNTATSNSIVVTPLANNNYSVLGRSVHGCSASATSSISVTTGPTLTVIGNQTVCSGASTTLTASGANSYSWTTGATTASAVVSPLVNSSYTVLGFNLSGCPGVSTVAVVSNSVPILLTQSSATSVCVNSPATFTVSGANSYSWSTGSTASVIIVNPAAAGSYTVSGINSLGCISAASIALGTYSLPVVSISSSSNSACAGTSLTLSASGANSYSWQSGPTTFSFVVTPTGNTTYTVSGTETINNCSNSAVASITVQPLPILFLNGNGPGVCDGNTATYTVSGANTYSWSTGSTAATMAVLPIATGTYNVNGVTSFGCADSLTFSLAVYPNPTVVVVPVSPTICANSPVTFTATGASGYLWSNTIQGAQYQVNPLANAVYTVIGTSTQGCSSAQTASVFVKAAPLLMFAPSANTLCVGKSGSFTVNGATSYTWGNGMQGSSFTYTTPPGGAVFSVIGSNTLGCSSSATVSVISLSLPVVQIVPASTVVCVGDPIELQASGAASYTWVPGGAVSQAISFTLAIPTTYSATGMSSQGCENTTEISIQVDVCTSVAELYNSLPISLYPNPTSGKTTVWKPGSEKIELTIFTTDGKLIQQMEIDTELTELNLSGLAKGVYFISIKHLNTFYHRRLILN